MIQLTRRDIEDAYSHASNLSKLGKLHGGKGERVVGAVAGQAESGLAAFGYGFLEGRYGPVKIGPVAADLLAGTVLHAAAIFGFAGKFDHHAHNFAQGLVDSYLTRLGLGMGKQSAIKSPPKISGEERFRGVISGTRGAAVSQAARSGLSPLTVAEIAALAQQVR